MKVVVTGGAGFIGANLCRSLVAAGYAPVVAVDDLSTGAPANLEGVKGVELVVASILDPEVMAEVVDGAASVVHLAAWPSVPRSISDPMRSHEVNVTGTMTTLEAARAANVGHVVFASSSSVYGANPVLPKSEDLATRPRSPYAAAKLAAEAYVLAYAHSFGMSTLAFRFFNVFGPLQAAGHAYAAVIPAFVSNALARKPVPVHGDGMQSRDFTFVRSVTDVLTAAVTGRVSSAEPVNLAFGTRHSLLDVIRILETLLETEIECEFLPPRPGDVPHSQADQSALRRLFPHVEPVEFAVGLRETIDWFRTGRRS